MNDVADLELLRRHKIDVSVYHRMGEVGIFHEDDRVELIDGEIIDMAPIGDDHSGTVAWLNRKLVIAFGERAIVNVQNPVRLDSFNEPQPDFLVLRPRDDFYRHRGHPSAADVLLLIEVADSSVAYDRRIKTRLYARYGVGEVWLVDLPARIVEVYRDPAPEGYRRVTRHGPAETIAPEASPDVRVELAVILD